MVATASEMSNLVGMWAFLIGDDKKIKFQAFINGKASNEYFIVQAIGAMDGVPNIAKLMTLKELSDWVIIPADTIDDVLTDYYKHGSWRFGFNID